MEKSGADPVTNANLLTILVEFDPEANDDFSGWERPDDPLDPVGCETEPDGTLFSGPVHNQLPNPATVGTGRDNNTFWVPDFSSSHYNKIIYSKTGLTQKVRTDLNGGVNLRGRTVRNHYLEMSKGTYDIGGTVTPWLMLPHSEAWYSADSCEAGRPAMSATPTTLEAPARWLSMPSPHSWRATLTSPSPTTTSRTRATLTRTATSTSPTVSSTTSW